MGPKVQTEIDLVDKVKEVFGEFGCEINSKIIPARICNHSVSMHKDRYNGVGAIVEDWVYLMYLKANGKLVLKDELTGSFHEISAKNGTMIAFPNSRFSHSYDADMENGDLRVMLGPVTVRNGMVTVSGGGCGGGCGGGGGDGGGGGCGGGDTGGGDTGGGGCGGGDYSGGACGGGSISCGSHDWGHQDHIHYYYWENSDGKKFKRRKKKNKGCCTIM